MTAAAPSALNSLGKCKTFCKAAVRSWRIRSVSSHQTPYSRLRLPANQQESLALHDRHSPLISTDVAATCYGNESMKLAASKFMPHSILTASPAHPARQRHLKNTIFPGTA